MQPFKGRCCAGIRAVAAGGGSGRVTALARGEQGAAAAGAPCGARRGMTMPGATGNDGARGRRRVPAAPPTPRGMKL